MQIYQSSLPSPEMDPYRQVHRCSIDSARQLPPAFDPQASIRPAEVYNLNDTQWLAKLLLSSGETSIVIMKWLVKPMCCTPWWTIQAGLERIPCASRSMRGYPSVEQTRDTRKSDHRLFRICTHVFSRQCTPKVFIAQTDQLISYSSTSLVSVAGKVHR